MSENKQDLVAVVRCGDCRYFCPARFEGIEPVAPPFCDKIGADFDDPPFYFGDEQQDSPYDYMDNGFCAWGERKLSDDEIDEIYNSNVNEDIKDIVEYGIMSKEDIAYVVVRKTHNDSLSNTIEYTSACDKCDKKYSDAHCDCTKWLDDLGI